MDKKTKLFVICFVILCGAFILVGFYAFVPDAKASMDYYLGPTGQNVANGLTGLWIGVTTSEAWLTYITPNLLWIGVVVGIVLTGFVFLPIKDAWTGFWSARHKVSIPSTSERIVSSSTPPGATIRPKETTQIVEDTPPPVEEKKEESETA